jgi:hypothetical protein
MLSAFRGIGGTMWHSVYCTYICLVAITAHLHDALLPRDLNCIRTTSCTCSLTCGLASAKHDTVVKMAAAKPGMFGRNML